ncbi:hypothetical protein SK1NUM_04250 [Arachnia rubra]|nr:hypothetical protein SK1NUM_04250 [Arachnia rubra]
MVGICQWEAVPGQMCAKATERNATGSPVMKVNEARHRIRGKKTPANQRHTTPEQNLLQPDQQVPTRGCAQSEQNARFAGLNQGILRAGCPVSGCGGVVLGVSTF